MRRRRAPALLLCCLAVIAAGSVLTSGPGAVASAATPGAPTIFFTVGAPHRAEGQLWSVRANGRHPRLLRDAMPLGPEGPEAVLTRDWRRILCLCRRGEIDSLHSDGSHLQRLGRRPAGTPVLSSNGWVLRVRRANRLLAQRPDGSRRHLVARLGAGIDERVVPSPRGDRVAFVVYGCLDAECSGGSGEGLETVSVRGGRVSTVYGTDEEFDNVQWSRDERKLIFSVGAGPEADPEATLPEDRWVLAPSDASGAGRVLPIREEIGSPFFSPAGSRLAVARLSRSGYEQLATIGLGDRRLRPLLTTRCRRPLCLASLRVIDWTDRG